MTNAFWVPKYKKELVKWLNDNCGMEYKSLNKMGKSQLYAIYFCARKSENQPNIIDDVYAGII